MCLSAGLLVLFCCDARFYILRHMENRKKGCFSVGVLKRVLQKKKKKRRVLIDGVGLGVNPCVSPQ